MSDSINVDLTLCAGHGKCYLLAPDVIEPRNDDGQAEWTGGTLGPDAVELRRRLERVIENCPEHALSWSAAHTEEKHL
jgi:ferredoxin